MTGNHLPITESILKSYFERRLGVIRDTANCQSEGLFAPHLRKLMRESLRLAESVLSAHFGPHHYELSIFINAANPEIVCYYDSAGYDYPRSHKAREKDPDYYNKNRYAVVDLLASPIPKLMVIPSTRKTSYSFSAESQRAAIGSTIIYNFAPELPAALVVVCDQGNTFSEKNPKLISFVRGMGMSLLADIELCRNCVKNSGTRSFSKSNVSAPGKRVPSKGQGWRFAWIHLSDMHFGAGYATHRFQQRNVMSAILDDVKKHAPKPINRIIVTGDIAFSANRKEYEEAYKWLKSLAKAAGVSQKKIRLVPGNHDIRRFDTRTGPAAALHDAIRRTPERLDDELKNISSRRQLSNKLKEYCRFARYIDGHPPAASHGIDWVENISSATGNGHPAIRLLGLCTVWVSDQLDGKQKEGDSSHLAPNMVISNLQIDYLFSGVRDDELILMLSHHTPAWLNLSSRGWLDSALSRFRYIHLCGHVHESVASVRRNLGIKGTGIRFVAGAAHSDSAEAQKHGYAWGMIKQDTVSKTLRIGWAPRIYVKERDQMRADGSRYDLDHKGFVWEKLLAIR